MTEPLTELIKREQIKTQLIKGDVCISLPVAASFMGVSRMTAYRWHKEAVYERYYVDKNGYVYVPIEIVENLRPDNRMIQISK